MITATLRPLLLIAALAAPLAAVSVDELVEAVLEELPEDVLLEPGNTALPEKLAALDAEEWGLGADGALELRLRVAEAWLGADQPEPAITAVVSALQAIGPRHPLRDRAGLALVAAWDLQVDQAEEPAALPDASKALAERGDFGVTVVARAHVVEARRRMAEPAYEAAIAQLDQALALLADDTARARVPVYALRVLAMEADGQAPEDIEAWLQARSGDPAVDLVLSSLMTDSQKLVGQPAPALQVPYADGSGMWKLADHAGKPVLLYFFATWAKSCDAVTPVVAQQAAAHPELAVVGVSLDTKDTIGRLDDYAARFGTTWPVVAEQLGWDGETDDQLHVEAIPHLMMIGADGRIAAVDLIGGDERETFTLLGDAIRATTGGGDAAAPGGQEDIP